MPNLLNNIFGSIFLYSVANLANAFVDRLGSVENGLMAYQWLRFIAGVGLAGELKEQLERDETFREALQNRIDSLTSDFVNRDDPAQRTQIADSRQKALSELDRVKKAIEQGKRAIPELEEEARRDGVPAGWLR